MSAVAGDPISSSFEDWNAFDGYDSSIGCPEAVVIDSQRVLVTTWMRRCYVLDLATKTLHAEPDIVPPKLAWLGVGWHPDTPSIESGVSPICAVATRAGWASVWRLGASQSITMYPRNHGSVNAVALKPGTDVLALGLGYYVLDSSADPKAFVELWKLVNPPEFLARRCLPGVVVDRLAWDSSGNSLLVGTGARSQDRGHVAMLEGFSLAMLDIAEVETDGIPICSALHLDSATGRAVVCMSNRLEIRRADELAEIEQTWELGGKLHAASFSADGREVLLTNGLRIDLWSRESRRLLPLPDCTGVALLPDGRGLGISRDGIVRLWRN